VILLKEKICLGCNTVYRKVNSKYCCWECYLKHRPKPKINLTEDEMNLISKIELFLKDKYHYIPTCNQTMKFSKGL